VVNGYQHCGNARVLLICLIMLIDLVSALICKISWRYVLINT